MLGKKQAVIVTVYRSGGAYDLRYIRALSNALRINASWEGDIVCLTDQPEQVEQAGIEAVSMEHAWPGWWSKIELFRPGLFDSPVIYLDLDTLVLGPIHEMKRLVERWTGDPLLIRGYHPTSQRYDLPASGIMAWQGSQMEDVYRAFVERYDRMIAMGKGVDDYVKGGDQGFIRQYVNPEKKLQDVLPPNYIAFKRQVRQSPDPERELKGARLLAWSGRPRLHEAVSGRDYMVSRYWGEFATEL